MLHGMKTWNICMIRTIYFSLADLWKEKCKKCDGEIIQRCDGRRVIIYDKILGTGTGCAGPGVNDEDHLLVAAVVVLDDGGCLGLLGLLGLSLRQASGPNAAGPVPVLSRGWALLAALVGPERLLDDLRRLVELPLLLVRQGQVGEVLFTLGWRLKLGFIFCFLLLFSYLGFDF